MQAEQQTKLCKSLRKIGGRLTLRNTCLTPPPVINTAQPKAVLSLLFHLCSVLFNF